MIKKRAPYKGRKKQKYKDTLSLETQFFSVDSKKLSPDHIEYTQSHTYTHTDLDKNTFLVNCGSSVGLLTSVLKRYYHHGRPPTWVLARPPQTIVTSQDNSVAVRKSTSVSESPRRRNLPLVGGGRLSQFTITTTARVILEVPSDGTRSYFTVIPVSGRQWGSRPTTPRTLRKTKYFTKA